MPPARRDPAAWGIATSYVDTSGRRCRPSASTVEAVLDALGADAERPLDGRSVVLTPGTRVALRAPCVIRLEDGGSVEAGGALPPDLPLGVHRLQPLDGTASRALIVAPPRCHLPRGMRIGGLAVQLYAARSQSSWGIGDLADLAMVGRWAAAQGAGVVLVSPLHAARPMLPQQPSPYSPSSRRFRSPLLLRVEDVVGARSLTGEAGRELRRLAAAGRALNADRHIDRDAVYGLKVAALEMIWEATRSEQHRALHAYVTEQGGALRAFAVHSALTQTEGSAWRSWPSGVRRPDGHGIEEAARVHADRVAFHSWVQWQVDRQLARASSAVPLMHDLAIGVDADGADAWADQDLLAEGVRVGAPADEFNTLGQDWGLPPYNPWRLRAAGYGPFTATVRAGFRHAGALRFDHVMGLFRLWWVPPGRGPRDGVYVRYPGDDLLAILALESYRAGAYVVGEDLGTVTAGTRRALAARAVLSYRLLWFEDRPPSRYPRRSMAAVTTHDLPTVAGLWTGSDVEAQRRLGLEPDAAATAGIRRRVRALGVGDTAPVAAVCAALHAALAAGAAAVVTATLDDLAQVEERPNMPGTVDTWPNWRLALPRPLEKVMAETLARQVMTAVAARGAPSPGPGPDSAGTNR